VGFRGVFLNEEAPFARTRSSNHFGTLVFSEKEFDHLDFASKMLNEKMQAKGMKIYIDCQSLLGQNAITTTTQQYYLEIRRKKDHRRTGRFRGILLCLHFVTDKHTFAVTKFRI